MRGAPHSDLDRLTQLAQEHRDLARDGRTHWSRGHAWKANAIDEAVAEIGALRDQVERLWSERDRYRGVIQTQGEYVS